MFQLSSLQSRLPGWFQPCNEHDHVSKQSLQAHPKIIHQNCSLQMGDLGFYYATTLWHIQYSSQNESDYTDTCWIVGQYLIYFLCHNVSNLTTLCTSANTSPSRVNMFTSCMTPVRRMSGQCRHQHVCLVLPIHFKSWMNLYTRTWYQMSLHPICKANAQNGVFFNWLTS